jgi:hypothetical protein
MRPMNNGREDRLSALLHLGAKSPDPVLVPEVDDSGSFCYAPDEYGIIGGASEIRLLAVRSGMWKPVLSPRLRGWCALTTQRLVYCWPQWKADSGFGSIVDRVVATRVLEREAGSRLLVGGHVRTQWVTSVLYFKPKRPRDTQTTLRVTVEDEGTVLGVDARSFPPTQVDEAARSFIKAVATNRLQSRHDLPPEAIHELESLASSPTFQENERTFQCVLPGAMKVGAE